MTSPLNVETWDDGRLFVNREYAPWLRAHGLTTLDAFFQYSAGQEINNHRSRPVFRLALACDQGPLTVYFKRYANPQWKNSLQPLLRGQGPRSMAGREWNAMLTLRHAGIPVPPPVAMGEEFRLGLETRSCLLTAEVPGIVPLNEYLEEARSRLDAAAFRHVKRRLICDAARLIRGMHEAGILHQDLYTKHILLQGEYPNHQLLLLDFQRVEQYRRLSRMDIGRELGGLQASAKFSMISATDRLRFFCHYRGFDGVRDADRRLLDKINRRTSKLLDRKKFQVMQKGAEGVTWRRAES